jgi:hypothetical protein
LVDVALDAAREQFVKDNQAIARAAESETVQAVDMRAANEVIAHIRENYQGPDIAEALYDLAWRHVWAEQQIAHLKNQVQGAREGYLPLHGD